MIKGQQIIITTITNVLPIYTLSHWIYTSMQISQFGKKSIMLTSQNRHQRDISRDNGEQRRQSMLSGVEEVTNFSDDRIVHFLFHIRSLWLVKITYPTWITISISYKYVYMYKLMMRLTCYACIYFIFNTGIYYLNLNNDSILIQCISLIKFLIVFFSRRFQNTYR